MGLAVATPPQAAAPLTRRALGIALFLLSFAIAVAAIANKHAIDTLLAGAGLAAYPIAIAVMGLVAAAPFSVTDALAVSNGVLFGPVGGSLVNAAGLVIGAFLSYRVARHTSKLLDLDRQTARLPAWVRRFRIGSPMFLILVRIIPGVGGTLATQIAAALRVPLLRHMLTFCLVTVPFCTLLAFGGHAVANFAHQHVLAAAAARPRRSGRDRSIIRLT